jgi:uncharacterized protein (DUF433 family)
MRQAFRRAFCSTLKQFLSCNSFLFYNATEMIQLELKQQTPLTQDQDNTVRVTGSRITLDTIVSAFKKGATAEQIQDSFPSLSLREIYGTIAYYLEHEADVETYLKARREAATALQQEIESQQNTAEFREKIRARQRQLTQV